ncbi:MAG: GTP 3',8-cyclase MoaA [Leptospirales bacterium]
MVKETSTLQKPGLQTLDLQTTGQKRFNVLRLSLTRKCNFNCIYCTEPEAKNISQKQDKTDKRISIRELLLRVKYLHKQNHFRKIRITGGEPLLIPGIVDCVSEIKSFGISEVHMTTNGADLAKFAYRLKHAGLSGVNVSLDAIDSKRYNTITGTDKLKSVLKGIADAQEAGLTVKVNAVLLKGMNETEILPLFEYASANNIEIRFLEFMNAISADTDLFLPMAVALQKIQSQFDIKKIGTDGNETCEKWITEQGYQFGFIANTSSPFCEKCDRLRMDSGGSLYGCIGATESISTGGVAPAKYGELLETAMLQKNSKYFGGIGPDMRSIGG